MLYLHDFSKKIRKFRGKSPILHKNFSFWPLSSKKTKQPLLNIGVDVFYSGKKWKMSKRIAIILIIVVTFQLQGFFTKAFAQTNINEPEQVKTLDNDAILTDLEVELINKELVIVKEVQKERDFQIIDKNEDVLVHVASVTVINGGVHSITAYNSEPDQTDSSPCITANGFNVCEHGVEDTIAANFLRFGTRVRIPELFGDRVFVVRDRMNRRYTNRIDIWMINKQTAKQFGVKYASIEILDVQ